MSTPLTVERWQRISECFSLALETPVEERVSFVTQQLANDPDSCAEVFQMLQASGDLGLLNEATGRWFSTPAVPSDSDLLPEGTVIAAFRITGYIGRGGMGEVYRAQRADGVFDQQVAIKLLRGGLWGDALVRRFEMERHILARLRHPDIVGIIDGGTASDGRPYLVMPFVQGRPITVDCEARNADLETRLRLVSRVAGAIQYAHTRLIVHRDIKPSNILVTEAGEVRLLDFGIAKLLDEDSDARRNRLPPSTFRLFTPDYGAPEQISGAQITAATDVYALGVLLYELLAGVRPHAERGHATRDMERAILEDDPAAPSTIPTAYQWRTRIRGDLDRIVLKALRREPDKRYATAAQLAEDIERFLGGLPVQASGDRLAYRAERFVRRHRVGVIAASAAVLALAAITLVTTVQARRLTAERNRVRQEQVATNTVVNLLQSLFAQSNPMVNPGGDSLRVSQVLDVGERMIDSLTAEPLIQARMWRTLGNMHFTRGRADRAKALLWRAYERYRHSQGADSLDVISTLHEYARVVDYFDGRETSLPIFRETVERLRNNVPPNSPDLRVAMREFSERLDDAKSRRAELERLARDTVSVSGPLDSMARASDLNALAVERFNAGEFREALALFTEVLAILTAKLPKDHPDRLLLMGNVAASRDRTGDYAGAEALARQTVELQRARTPVQPIALGAAMEYLATTMARRGYLSEADSIMRAVIELRTAHLPPDHLDVVRGLQNQMMIANARGRTTDALRYADSAETLLRISKSIPPNHKLGARVRRLQALVEAGHTSEARELANAITEEVRTAFPAPHPNSTLLEMSLGTLALSESRETIAKLAFATALSAMAKQLPPDHPELAGAQCALSLLQPASAGGGSQTDSKWCHVYTRFGLASPTIRRLAQRRLRIQ